MVPSDESATPHFGGRRREGGPHGGVGDDAGWRLGVERAQSAGEPADRADRDALAIWEWEPSTDSLAASTPAVSAFSPSASCCVSKRTASPHSHRIVQRMMSDTWGVQHASTTVDAINAFAATICDQWVLERLDQRMRLVQRVRRQR